MLQVTNNLSVFYKLSGGGSIYLGKLYTDDSDKISINFPENSKLSVEIEEELCYLIDEFNKVSSYG